VSEVFRVAIIGSGPAGLSAAAHAAKLGLRHVLIEKTDHLSDTIFRYQRGKHVMATPSQLVLRSDVAFDAGKREAVLGRWDEDARAAGVELMLNTEVKAIAGAAGAFTLMLSGGRTIEAETVVLGIGTQGNPNTMRCDGGNSPWVQYSLDDPAEYVDEHIIVIGAGDAGIENAIGLAADPEQRNIVTILNRSADFARAKDANVAGLNAARDAGRLSILLESSPTKIEPGFMTVETRDGEARLPCDRVIARMGSSPPRKFIEACGVQFSSDDREAFPTLSPTFESTTPGLYVIGALAGYPLIKHCMNQGYDVIEFIAGNTALKPADEPILENKLAGLPGRRSVAEWLDFLRTRVEILNDLSPLQMREFLLDSGVRAYRAGEIVFQRNNAGSSLFGIAEGSVLVEVSATNPSITVPIAQGSIFGEVGLISGRRRGATIRAAEDCIIVEVSRLAALKLMASVPAAKRAINRITTERLLLQMFGSGLKKEDLGDIIASSDVRTVRKGEVIINEGEEGSDIFAIRSGSMVIEKLIGGKPRFLSYLPAGTYVGEMALLDNSRRTATVRAAIKSDVIRLDGAAFRALLDTKPELLARARKDMAARRDLNGFIESKKDSFGGVIDLYSSVATFLVEQGVGEATDVLLIDETLCVGCDNCEKACADSHDGLSRLDREAGRTYAHLHVPTSCRHCEHPHCMADCPPNAIHRGPDGEVFIDDSCIGCGNCERNCPYGVIRMDKVPPKKPSLLSWLTLGFGPGPGEPSKSWSYKHAAKGVEAPKKAIKCDMCAGQSGGPACVRACPTGAAIRVSPEQFLSVALLDRAG
jgi:CRP-like cAMP-binding protein/Fe-S-cluster-containing hydrogenase component 2/thioredoxin reductase